MADLNPDDFLYGPLSHAALLGEKDLRLALALGRATGVDLPLAQVAIENLAVGLGVPHGATGTKE
jgi:3-hydroxyisobutyrate dehydrogenase-like beta-hydroxyacid dehydrogenase